MLERLPLTVLFDYAAAFPSVAHKWLRSILRKIKIPKGWLNAFNSLYTGSEAYTNVGGLLRWLFSVKCGVLQGCPVSGSLFVIAIDPLLTLFEHYIHNPLLGLITACADDIGTALKGLNTLKLLYKHFERYRKVSGLCLKPSKCIAIVLGAALNADNIRIIKAWLADNIPEWKHFELASSGKYLGIHLGPKVGGSNWQAPLDKAWIRVEDISDMKAPLPYASALFSSKALSVVGYVFVEYG